MSNIDLSQLITAEAKAETAKADLLALIAARRWQAQSAGIVFNGASIDTDRDAQVTITGALLAWPEEEGYSVNWKTKDGTFLPVDKAGLQAILQAGFAYTQACFDREAVLASRVQDGTYTNAMLNQGWPKREVGDAA